MSKLKGKVAIVTGASKGIGAAIAKALAVEGASVVANYASNKSGADSVVKSITETGGVAVAVRGDVTKAADARALIDETIKNFGRLDILVNNSGIYDIKPLEAVTEELLHNTFGVNVIGLILVTQAAVKHLNEGGSIINIGSTVSSRNPPNTVVYTATKGAVNSITRVLAKELGPKKIRVNALNPGYVMTDGSAIISGTDYERNSISQTPLGRAGQPEDVAPVAVFLASDDARWITGELLFASGGLR